MNWLSFFIGALVGWLVEWLIDYLLWRPRRQATEADLQNKWKLSHEEATRLGAQAAGTRQLQADLDACRKETAQQRLEIERLNEHLAAASARSTGVAAEERAEDEGVAVRAPEAVTAITPAAPPVEPDDLTALEGIGPKIAALLNENGISTFAQLAETSVERLQSILSSGGARFAIADPHSWPEQARLARDGKWDELKAYTDSLKGGRII